MGSTPTVNYCHQKVTSLSLQPLCRNKTHSKTKGVVEMQSFRDHKEYLSVSSSLCLEKWQQSELVLRKHTASVNEIYYLGKENCHYYLSRKAINLLFLNAGCISKCIIYSYWDVPQSCASVNKDKTLMVVVKCYLPILGTLPTASWAFILWDDLLIVRSSRVLWNLGGFS